MKKLILGMAAMALMFTSCNDDQSENVDEIAQENVDMSDFYVYTDFTANDEFKAAEGKKNCYSMQHLNHMLNKEEKL